MTARSPASIQATAAVRRLAIYGSLAPGQINHDQIAGLSGIWAEGQVRGNVAIKAHGADAGYPALTLDPAAPAVAVLVFTSDDLPTHWDRLDAFEGAGYRRVAAEVETASGPVAAQVYVAA